MKILVVGSGGREHALIWKIRQSPNVETIYCAPGNAGIGELAELVPLQANDLKGLLKFARSKRIDLTVVGPEVPLTLGIVDLFENDGMKIFGPRQLASEIEGSKAFAKQFMKRYHIPTAEFRTFHTSERYEAERYINELPPPVVLKADGLAAGKGVVVCETKDKAFEVLNDMMVKKIFGNAGKKVVIEEFMIGEEASVFAVTDGKHFTILPPAQDHKRILDGDQGKNTGGMGAYAPAPVVTEKLLEKIKRTIIQSTLDGLAAEGRTYRGCLYCGLMITETGPKVVEFNCRFGDPEAQVVLPLIDGDFIDLLLAACSGDVRKVNVKQHDAVAVCVVMASRGYPDEYQTGKVIIGLDAVQGMERIIVFHAGTKKVDGNIVTSGGRVLGVTALREAEDFEGTISLAYNAVSKITFDGAYYRSDIGIRGLEKLKSLNVS